MHANPTNLSLSEIRDSACRECPLHTGARTVCLMGHGNTSCSLMLVGEAPGEDEDIVGKPFVGKSGKLLDNILLESGIVRSEVYISNAVKCRPPSNRTPKQKEIDTCRHYLIAEIRAIRPKLIVGLGRVAMQSLLNTHQFVLKHGRGGVFYLPDEGLQDIPIIATYHPAFISRDISHLAPCLEDFVRVKEVLEYGVPEKVEAKYYHGVSPYKKHVVVDLETTGLDMFAPDGDILCVGTSNKDHTGYCTPDVERTRKVLTDPSVVKIGHNAKFDYKWLRTKGIRMRGSLHDTLVAAHLLDENLPSYGLKELAIQYTNMGRYAEPMERAVKLVKKDMRKVPAKIRDHYCAMDVDATHQLYALFKPQLKEQGLWPLYQLSMAGMKVMAEAECSGVKIDMTRHAYLSKLYRKKITRFGSEIKEVAGEDFNVNSTVQLANLLVTQMGMPVISMTKKNRISMTKATLLQMLPYDKSDVLKKVLLYRKYNKEYGLYFKEGCKFVSADGFVHTDIKIHGARTGRYSSTNPNLQNIPKVSQLKTMFVSRFKRGQIVQIDYDQGELRILAHQSQDKRMLAVFRAGKDIHSATAAEVLGKKIVHVTEEERAMGKTLNFAIIYGIQAFHLGERLGISTSAASRFLKEYRERYKGVAEYIAAMEEQIVNDGFVTSLFGRKRRILIGDPDDEKYVAKVKRQAVNAPIQGGLGDLNVLSTVALSKRIRYHKMKTLILFPVHDSLVLDCPTEEVDLLKNIANDVFCNPDTSKFGFKFNVPLTIGVGFGSNWKEASENG